MLILACGSTLADEDHYAFSIASKDLDKSLRDLAAITRTQILYSGGLVDGKQSVAVIGTYTVSEAIELMLHDTGLTFSVTQSGVYLIQSGEAQRNAAPSDSTGPDSDQRFDRRQHDGVDSGEGASRALEEIIVNAMRRADDLQDVAMSVATMTGSQVAVLLDGGADVHSLASRLPSLYVEGSSGRTAPRFYIRGLGNTDFDLTASQPVSVVVDDVVMENVLLKGFPLFDLEQVELLRGPQGSLFGRNTPAGIVRFETLKPTYDLTGYASASIGNHNSSVLRGAVGGGLSDNVSARIALQSSSRDDYVDNAFVDAPFASPGPDLGGYSDNAGRLHVAIDAAEAFDVLLTLQHRSLRGTTTLFRANVLDPGGSELNERFGRDVVYYDGGRNNASRVETSSAAMTITADLGPAVLSSITGYFVTESRGIADVDGGAGVGDTPNSGFIPERAEAGTEGREFTQFTQESRLSGRTETFAWHAGLYYFRDSSLVDNLSFDGVGGPVPTRVARLDQSTDAWAIFGQMTYWLDNGFSLSAGLRSTYDRKDFAASRPVADADPIPSPIERTVKDSHISWDVSARYEVSDSVSAYTRLANGFRSPSVQGRLLFNDVVSVADSETVNAIEFGMKSELLEKRVRFNASAYYYRLSDPQFTAVGGDGNLNRLVNAKSGRGIGAELDAHVLLGDLWEVFLGISFNDTEIDDPALFVVPCASQCTILDPIRIVDGVEVAEVNGNPFPQAPRWIVNASLKYDYPLDSGQEFFAYVDWFWQGKTNFFLYESAEFRSEGNSEVGLKVGYRSANEALEMALFARNVFDRAYLQGAIDFNNLTGFVNEPRVWGAEISYRF